MRKHKINERIRLQTNNKVDTPLIKRNMPANRTTRRIVADTK